MRPRVRPAVRRRGSGGGTSGPRRLYEHLGLGGFDEFAPRVRQYFAAKADYATNKFDLTTEQRAIVTERWAEVIDRYGYRAPELGNAALAG